MPPPSYPPWQSLHLLVVHALLKGPKDTKIIRLVVDTGATTTIIPPQIALAIGCNPVRAKHHLSIITASGLEYLPVVTVPVIESLESLPPHEQCHLITPVRFGRRRSDQCGHLELTSARLKFHGVLDVSVSWSEVVTVERTGHEVGVVLAHNPRVLRFCCHAISEAARATLIARHLAAGAAKSTT